MKVKATPKIETVRGILQERITQEREYLVGHTSALEALTSGGATALYSPGKETEKRSLQQAIRLSEQSLKQRETEMILLQSHGAPRVLVEIEV